MTPAPRTAPRAPVAATPVLREGVFRRSTYVDVGPSEGQRWLQQQPVRLAFAGELRDEVGGGDAVSAAKLEARVDEHRDLTWLVTVPSLADGDGVVGGLIGQRVGPGFRRVVESVHVGPVHDPIRVLLFDLPTAALISGYAEIRSRTLAGIAPGDIVGPEVLPYVEEVCAGWASDGLMVSSIRRGEGVPIQDCPEAPALEDPWPGIAPLRIGWLRRRRRIDLSEGAIDAMFRDSYAEPDGRETVLHEYSVVGRLEADGAIGALEATPRVLPFAECPLAADNVARLRGTPGAQLRSSVRDELGGTAGCTHLNDLLAAIGDAVAATA
ncbi:MAG: DUF2889 domain-containing protein [Actinobacteria bacterium]|nr:DUF2889 domain-containing protein [Actinomycetota bacterium]